MEKNHSMVTTPAESKIERDRRHRTTTESSQHYQPTHQEQHSSSSAIISDVIIGFADGLTVPFALTAELSSVGSLNLGIIGGLAELFAGAVSMGLDAFLAVVTEDKHYRVEEAREWRQVALNPQAEEADIYELMAEYGLDRECVRPIVEDLKTNKDMWVKVDVYVLRNARSLLTYMVVHDGF
jgi:hypothetical protein